MKQIGRYTTVFTFKRNVSYKLVIIKPNMAQGQTVVILLYAGWFTIENFWTYNCILIDWLIDWWIDWCFGYFKGAVFTHTETDKN